MGDGGTASRTSDMGHECSSRSTASERTLSEGCETLSVRCETQNLPERTVSERFRTRMDPGRTLLDRDRTVPDPERTLFPRDRTLPPARGRGGPARGRRGKVPAPSSHGPGASGTGAGETSQRPRPSFTRRRPALATPSAAACARTPTGDSCAASGRRDTLRGSRPWRHPCGTASTSSAGAHSKSSTLRTLSCCGPAELVAALPSLPEVFDREDIERALGYKPSRPTLNRAFSILREAQRIVVEVAGHASRPTSYRKLPVPSEGA